MTKLVEDEAPAVTTKMPDQERDRKDNDRSQHLHKFAPASPFADVDVQMDVSLLRKTEADSYTIDSLQDPPSRSSGARWPRPRFHGAAQIGRASSSTAPCSPGFSPSHSPRTACRNGRRRLADALRELSDSQAREKSALRDALRPIARRHDTTVSALAIAWTLVWPGVTGAIVGARSAEQVDGWIGAATLELTAGDLDDITRAIEKTGAGTGPTRPAIMRENRESAATAQTEARL